MSLSFLHRRKRLMIMQISLFIMGSRPKPPPVYTSRYRAASPVLRHLELESAHYPLRDILQANKEPFIDKARQILEHYGIVEGDDTNVDLLHRQRVPYQREPIATLYITTPWKKDSTELWPRAVEDIKTHVDGVIQGRDGIDLHVEMMAPERFQLKNLGPVTGEPRLTSSMWDSVRNMISEKLDSCEVTRRKWVTIGLFRLGFSDKMEENPITIYISLSYESDESRWEEVIVMIEDELRERNLDFVEVHLEHNVGWGLGWDEEFD
ncbi:hypothetical protein BHE90_011421 [Fusarium euwallaceae]|uniref:Uncharacterized protein n=1 Tax=Fusarium euwallaceae TaxID=1147111 RepID=A0A430LEJ8_9HYPO|nr:hypothetical protein BHE90_011421 [Fusarium euwallaceae]